MARKKRKKSSTPPSATNDSKQQNNKRKSNDISPATNKPKQKIANQNVTPAPNQIDGSEGTTPQECSPEQQPSQTNLNNTTSDDSEDSHRLLITESELNVTKELFQDNESVTNSDGRHDEINGSETDSNNEEEQEHMEIESVVEEYPPKTFHHNLPTLEHVLSLSKWRDGEDPQDKDGRYKRNGEYAKALLNSPIDPELHTIEKERQHKSRENFKSLYGSYADSHGKDLQIDANDLLSAVVKHINKDHIDAFYKTTNSKFIVVLKKKEHKENFTREKNFKEKIHNEDIIFRILTRLPKPKDWADPRYPDSVFVTMFLPTTISEAAVETAFMGFGKVHYVRAGTYRNEFADIKNGKRHVRITPHSGKSGLPHEIKFEEHPRAFRVMWPEKVVFCKFCGTAHQLRTDCDEKKAVNNNHPPNGEGSILLEVYNSWNQLGTIGT